MILLTGQRPGEVAHMSLSAAQIEARKGKLTASRIACLMTGDAPAIMRLYREMIGEELPEDLSHIWPVRLGEATEQLNLDWYEEGGGSPVTRRGEVVGHPKHLWAAATLDGWDSGPVLPDRGQACRRARAARGRDRSLPTADAMANGSQRSVAMRAFGHHGRESADHRIHRTRR